MSDVITLRGVHKFMLHIEAKCYVTTQIIVHVCGKQFTQLQHSRGVCVDSIPMHVESAFQTPAGANGMLVLKTCARIQKDKF